MTSLLSLIRQYAPDATPDRAGQVEAWARIGDAWATRIPPGPTSEVIDALDAAGDLYDAWQVVADKTPAEWRDAVEEMRQEVLTRPP